MDDGTTGSMDEMSLRYTDETSLSANVFARPGYTFEGWSVEAGGEKKYDDEEVVSGLKSGNGERITLYPVWTANEYTVHFDAGGGEEIEDAVYTMIKNMSCQLLPEVNTDLWAGVSKMVERLYTCRVYQHPILQNREKLHCMQAGLR